MIAFQPKGPLLSFTADSTAPTSVQAVALGGEQAQQYVLTNTSSSVDVVVGFGPSDVAAKLNAVAGTTVMNCYYLVHGTQLVLTAGSGSYFTGISASSAVVKVQAGIGI
jgi:hypothetical protein